MEAYENPTEAEIIDVCGFKGFMYVNYVGYTQIELIVESPNFGKDIRIVVDFDCGVYCADAWVLDDKVRGTASTLLGEGKTHKEKVLRLFKAMSRGAKAHIVELAGLYQDLRNCFEV